MSRWWAMTPSNAVTDEDVLAAIEEAIEEGDTDIGGGAPPPAIAARLPIMTRTVAKRVRDLEDEGVIEQVWGLGGPHSKPRRSYVPQMQPKED